MKKVILMLAVAAMASCAKSELTERPAAAGDVELKFGTTVLGIDTRTPFEGSEIDASDHKLDAQVLASTESHKYYNATDSQPAFVANGTVHFTNKETATGFDPAVYYPTDATKTVYVYGLYPLTWTVDTSGDFATHAINGWEDLMVAPEKTGTKQQAQNDTHPQLAFQHVLAKYIVEVKAKTADAITAWGTISGIELTKELNEDKPKHTCKVEYAKGISFDPDNNPNPTFEEGDGSAIKFNKATGTGTITYTDTPISDSETITLETDAKTVAYALVAPIYPKQGDADKVTLSVTTEKGGVVEVPVTLNDTSSTAVKNQSTAGKVYTITLSFVATELQVEATVTEWAEGGKKEEEIQ